MIPPTHSEIAQCAESIWQDYGRPVGRDTEIWLEAERQLTSQESLATADEMQRDHEHAEQAAAQEKKSRTPQKPPKAAPRAAPAATGKPLWSKPHSR